MPPAVAAASSAGESLVLHWLALTLTPGLGPTRARRLAEHFGSVQNIFKASLTELEATGIHAASAQSLGTGRSMELANDEMGRVNAAGVSVICLDDVRSAFGSVCAGEGGCNRATGNRDCGHSASHAVRTGNGGAIGV